MPETGGTATQAGIHYQNSVAAMALADLLDLDQRIARERAVEVRLEAPEDVDDIVIRFADGHHEFQNVKLNVRKGTNAWSRIWCGFAAQHGKSTFCSNDQLTLVVAERSRASEAAAAICERAASAIDEHEFLTRLTYTQTSALNSIASQIGSTSSAYELLRQTSVLHFPLTEIDRELARRRLAGGQSPDPTLLPILRDIVGGAARRRGLFHPAPLRRRLKLEHGMLLGEPPEWGLESYRTTIKRLARIEVPGMGVAGPADELFVWPRAREHDRMRSTGFEDETPEHVVFGEADGLDLRVFPNDQFDRVVVVAGPGYGKSALLTSIAGQLADGPLVPVSIPLASLASADVSLISFLSTSISQELDLTADWQRLAEQGLLVLLLDGLDEVPSAARPMLTHRIATFSARYPQAPWMLTVRDPAVMAGLPEATIVELLPLNDDDIERFADTMKSYLGDVDAWEIVHRLKLYPDLERLTRIPLFLVMFLTTFDLTNYEQLTRSDLIEAYLKTLFNPDHHKPMPEVVVRSVVLRAIAETLAFERLERQEIGATEREVRHVVSRVSESPSESEVLLEQLKSNGILKRQSAIRLQFPYPIVQEYLAACNLINHHADGLEQRIDDAMQRPWAQVIQFGLELHSDPEPIIRAMLARPDDAFSTGLRLVGRCIANGATVSAELREDVGNRLVEYWAHAPSRSRERVGRVLADGFLNPRPESLFRALHHRWLLNDGGGEIISKLNDLDLTLSVLDSLIAHNRSSIMVYHSLKPALSAAGDAAVRAISNKMDPDSLQEDEIIEISSLFSNFSSCAVSRTLALSIARNCRLPAQARMRAYELASSPLETDGVTLALAGFRHSDWDRHYEASDLVKVHEEPTRFLGELLRDSSIPLQRRQDLASDVCRIIPDAAIRRAFSHACNSDSSVNEEIKLTLQLFEARFGDRVAFERLVEGIQQIPIQHAATTFALFGHFPDRALAERAVTLICKRILSTEELVRIANSVGTGMLYIFEMDFRFAGILRPARPHPGVAACTDLLEDWIGRGSLSPQGRLTVATVAAQLGSEWARAKLEADVLAIDDMDGPEWLKDDAGGHALSHALREVLRRKPILSSALIDRVVASSRYNIAATGISALQVLGDADALRRLIDIHQAKSDWFLRDTIANAIELMAAKQGVLVQKIGRRYQLAC